MALTMMLSFAACANTDNNDSSSPSGMPGASATVPATNTPSATPATPETTSTAEQSPEPTDNGGQQAGNEQENGEVTPEAIWETIYERYGDTFPVTEAVPAETLKELTGIDPEKLERFVFQYPMMNVSASEFFIGKCKEGELESVKEEVMAHQAALVEQWKQYLPEQLKLVEAYVMETADNYVFFAVAENAEGAAEIFKGYFE